MKTITLLLTVLLTVACSSKRAVQMVDDTIESHGSLDGAQVGLNRDREIIIQQESDIVGELKIQQLSNYEREQKLEYLKTQLLQCREEMASPILGGNGEVAELPEIEAKAFSKVKESIGMNEQKRLVVVKREHYEERLTIERSYGEVLGRVEAAMKDMNGRCQSDMNFVRVKNGFPANRYSGAGHFTPEGTWVTERKAEHNIDDAVEIRASLSQKKAE